MNETICLAYVQLNQLISNATTIVALPQQLQIISHSLRRMRYVIQYSELSTRAEILTNLDMYLEISKREHVELLRFYNHLENTVLTTFYITKHVLEDIQMIKSGI